MTHCSYIPLNNTPESLVNEGDNFYNGTNGFTQNYDKAYVCYLKATKSGSYHWAFYNVGKCYQNGHGVTQNHDEARKWFLKAKEINPDCVWTKERLAELGDRVLMCEIGDCYYDGRAANQGYHRDPGKAFYWYCQSADRGYHWGIHNIGKCYLEGQGVAKNDEEAKQRFRVAFDIAENLWSLYWLAELGDEEAARRVVEYRHSSRLYDLLNSQDRSAFLEKTKEYPYVSKDGSYYFLKGDNGGKWICFHVVATIEHYRVDTRRGTPEDVPPAQAILYPSSYYYINIHDVIIKYHNGITETINGIPESKAKEFLQAFEKHRNPTIFDNIGKAIENFFN